MNDAATPTPPRAAPRAHAITLHGRVHEDPWAWLRDRDDPEVLPHLERENDYAAAMLAAAQPLQDQLVAEMVARIPDHDETAPVPEGPFAYAVRTTAGRDYAVHVRRPVASPQAEPEIVLDENALAAGQRFFALRELRASPDHRRIAYAVDLRGDEHCCIRVRELAGGQDHDDAIEDAAGQLAWSADGTALLYLRLDHADRPHALWLHRLGTAVAQDVLLYQEPDERFHLRLRHDRSGRFVILDAASRTSSELRLFDAHDLHAPPRLVAPRRDGVEYDVAIHGERLFIVTNADAPEFMVMEAPLSQPDPTHWRPLLPYRDDTHVDRVEAFAGHLLVWLRREGVPRLRVLDLRRDTQHEVEMPEPIYALDPGPNRCWDTATARFYYSSMVTPLTAVDYDMDARRWIVRKRYEVPGHEPATLVVERLHATAPDGTAVPISLVRRRQDIGRAVPLLLQAYGAYGRPLDARFSSHRLSLLQRGVAVAIAHVRGGGELGRRWYEQGRVRHKPNSFHDTIAAAEHLLAAGIARADALALQGGSAGGLLVGAVLNLRPELFTVAVADVPFVDVLNTMLDPSLPLTVIEREEWGDPLLPEDFEAIAAWSPYENVRAARYPALLATAGWTDPRVGYWEAAKWIAKLRHVARPGGELLLRTSMGAGHGGPSGRYPAISHTAVWFAFVLRHLGVAA
ncbi:MAG: S9 family peptidase [Nannocystaceae bacterium]|nr:S9 family peptidase [Nannocystaceae bacterium]